MPRIDHLLPLPLPLPCVGEPTAASRVSPGSSPARSDASEGAGAFYAADDEQPDPEPEASAGRSTQMLLAMAAMGARGGPYGRRPASSYGSCAAWSAGSLTEHRPASPSPICSPVSSKGRDGYRDGGEHRDDSAVTSFVTSREEEEQERLPTRGDFMKFPATPRNIRLQTPRHPSLLDQRVHGSNRGPPRFVHRASNRGLLQVPVPRLRKRIATHLKNSNNTFAMLNTFNEVDMTNLMKLLFDYKDEIFKKHGFKLCTMSCFVMAVVSALQNQPTMNSVGTSKGLVVPISTGTAVYGSLISTDEAGKEER